MATHHLTELMKLDLASIPVEAHAWTQKIYAARIYPETLGIWWHRLWMQLDLQSDALEEQDLLTSLLFLGLDLAPQVELDTSQAGLCYHGVSHIVDVLIVSTHMLMLWKNSGEKKSVKASIGPAWNPSAAGTLLIAGLCHDWGHDGGPAARQPSLEQKACDRMATYWQQAGPALGPKWVHAGQLAQSLILATHAAQVTEIHHRFQNLTLPDQPRIEIPMEDWLSILLTESDIAVSLLPQLGLLLSAKVQQEQMEWNQKSNSPAQTVSATMTHLLKMRQLFLNGVQLSSSCAQKLGLQKMASRRP